MRIKQETDLRRFPPIPRATKQFEERYKGRTAVERVNEGAPERSDSYSPMPGL